ncbi:MAG: DNA-directed RNA polymerase subunit delta, partial [Longicatena sp.]
MKKAMIDEAYDLMSKKKKAIVFVKLWEEVAQIMAFTQAQEEDNIAQFYSDLSLDDRFVNVGNNKWDLRERHTYKEAVIDTSDILIETDDDSDDYSDDSEEETEKKPKEEE